MQAGPVNSGIAGVKMQSQVQGYGNRAHVSRHHQNRIHNRLTSRTALRGTEPTQNRRPRVSVRSLLTKDRSNS